MFGQPKLTGSLFGGSSAATAPATGGLFGGAKPAVAPTGGLFGASTTKPTTTTGYGVSQPQNPYGISLVQTPTFAP
jgi:hypothetical protein